MDGILESGAGRRAQRIVAIGATTGAVAGAIIVAAIHFTVAPVAKTDRAYWTVSGPPCQEVSQTHVAHIGRPLAQMSDFGAGHFARVSGAILCNDVKDGFGMVQDTVCQFNRPRALGVWSKGGVRFFDMPGGEPATVTVSDSEPPRCVMASNYKGD